MSPERKKIISDHKVEEYVWGRKLVVYIDSRASEMRFDEITEKTIGRAVAEIKP